LPSPIAAITLTGFYFGLGMMPDILAERPADIVGFLELAFVVPPDIALVAAGIDQFALSHDPLHELKRETPEELVGSPSAPGLGRRMAPQAEREPFALGTDRGRVRHANALRSPVIFFRHPEMGKRCAVVLTDHGSLPFLAGALRVVDPVLAVVPGRHSFLQSWRPRSRIEKVSLGEMAVNKVGYPPGDQAKSSQPTATVEAGQPL
jgi:hypothetical protein